MSKLFAHAYTLGGGGMAEEKLRLGVAGLGRAFTLMLPTLVKHPAVELVAAADPRPEARARFAADYAARGYATVEELAADPAVAAIYVASPHQYHRAHVEAAARCGKHALVEKPMALTIADCRAMVEAAEAAGVQLVIGHSHSFDAPIARTRELIAQGAYGRLRMISALNFTDFLYRPRRPEELATDQGGGVVFNQAPHQVDTVRLLGGGRLKSVRAATGAWDAERPTEGAYSAFLTFEDGAFASIVYSGYAHFDSDEFADWIAESGLPKDPAQYGATRRLLAEARDELALKTARNYGGPEFTVATPSATRQHQHFGLVIASCERADLRPLPQGVMVYGDAERRFEALDPPEVPRREVIDELLQAIRTGRPGRHSGRWGLATMEAAIAILASAREGREIPLVHQTGLESI